jgi:hypothetical protein
MTSEPYPHCTIKSCAVEDDWFVYEVEPNDKIRFVVYTGEYQTRSATVLRNLGKARAFVQRDPEHISLALPVKKELARQRKRKLEPLV